MAKGNSCKKQADQKNKLWSIQLNPESGIMKKEKQFKEWRILYDIKSKPPILTLNVNRMPSFDIYSIQPCEICIKLSTILIFTVLKQQTLHLNQYITNFSFIMDTRLTKSPSQQASLPKLQTQQEINDSIIFNIMKKIQMRERLISEYQKDKQQQNTGILSKYFIHSTVPLYYFTGVACYKLYKSIFFNHNSTFSAVYNIPNLLFHFCVILSLNEYYKYKAIFEIRPEMGEQYRIYQKNVDNLVDEKIKRFSLVKKITSMKAFDPDRLTQIFKYRLVV